MPRKNHKKGKPFQHHTNRAQYNQNNNQRKNTPAGYDESAGINPK